MPALTTKSGQTVVVSEHRVAAWEARGYSRVDQPAAAEEPQAPAKKTAKKSSKKK